MKNFFYWAPRILSIAFVLFLSIFALDVFGPYSGWDLVVALFIHLVPSLVLLVLTIIAWRYDLVGAIAFLLLAIGYVALIGLGRHWSWYVAISLPAIVTAVLFFVGWLKRVSPR